MPPPPTVMITTPALTSAVAVSSSTTSLGSGEATTRRQPALRLARLRYDNGYTSFIEVLDAERSLFNVQLQYTQTHQVQLQAMVNLYLAMGGGWVVDAEKTAPASGAR